MSNGKFMCIMFTVVQTLTNSIKNYYNIEYVEVLEKLYNSKLYKALEKEETKMLYFSNYDLFRMFMNEQNGKNYFEGYY